MKETRDANLIKIGKVLKIRLEKLWKMLRRKMSEGEPTQEQYGRFQSTITHDLRRILICGLKFLDHVAEISCGISILKTV